MLRSIVSRAVGLTGNTFLRRSFSQISNKHPLTAYLKNSPVAFRPIGSVMGVHDARPKGDDELVNFLSEEIATEKKGQKSAPLPSILEGFQIKLNQSEVTLTKQLNNESLTITLNVNHTVDADFSEDASQPKSDKEPTEMRSRPNFEVDIKKGNQTLTFTCSYLQEPVAEDAQQEEYRDAFVIDEISLYEGEYDDEVYAVAGDILDGYLYDLFMNMLEERGVSNEFVDKLSDFSTDYEHQLYVSMLGHLQKFLTSK